MNADMVANIYKLDSWTRNTVSIDLQTQWFEFEYFSTCYCLPTKGYNFRHSEQISLYQLLCRNLYVYYKTSIINSLLKKKTVYWLNIRAKMTQLKLSKVFYETA